MESATPRWAESPDEPNGVMCKKALSDAPLASGLDRVDSLAIGRGFVEASVALSAARLAAQLDAGYRASANTSIYGYARGETDWRGGWVASAGVGVRF